MEKAKGKKAINQVQNHKTFLLIKNSLIGFIQNSLEKNRKCKSQRKRQHKLKHSYRSKNKISKYIRSVMRRRKKVCYAKNRGKTQTQTSHSIHRFRWNSQDSHHGISIANAKVWYLIGQDLAHIFFSYQYLRKSSKF